MYNNSLISIVVPIYNASSFLDECIKSIISQSYPHIEILLIDDGSTDNSLYICNSYAESDERIRVYSKINAGVSSARNYGIRVASGEYICFIDSDDYIDSDFCLKLIEKLTPDTHMVVLGMRSLRNNIEEKINYRLKSGYYNCEKLRGFVVDDGTFSGFTFGSSCSVLFELQTVKENNIMFNEKIKYNEDGLFSSLYILSLDRGNICIDYSECPYVYRMNESSASHTVDIKRFVNDMDIIDSTLLSLSCTEIHNQIKLRKASLAIAKLFMYKKNSELTYKKVKEVISNEAVLDAFDIISISNLNNKKRIITILIRLRQYLLLYIILKNKK